MSTLRKSILGPAIAVAAMLMATSAVAQDLSVGDKAPSINIEHWLSDGNGKFDKVAEFEEGKVYVVEFWATWCGPCIASMPHIVELQNKYAESGVQVISVSDEDLDTVEEFLERDVRGEDKTYAELTSAYCLTTDPDESVYDDYMLAAGQNGIPTAFIVGKTGNVEWIGHPMEMDEPLDMIVSDSWDLEEWKKSQEAEAAAEAAVMDLIQKIGPMVNEGEFEEALEAIDEEMAGTDNEQLQSILKQIRFSILMESGGEQLVGAFNEMVEENKKDAMMLNQISWAIVEKHMAGGEVSEDMINAAAAAAELAVEQEPEDGAILDTLAHLLHMQGDLDRAIEVQEKAVEYAGDQFGSDLSDYLDELKAEKEEAGGGR
ncbi:MAG: redoxin domain-containing protein [Planctomycetota bacterium]